MGFTNEDRYLPLSTKRMLKVLRLAKKKSHCPRTDSEKMHNLKHISDFSQQDLRLKCMLVRCRCPGSYQGTW